MSRQIVIRYVKGAMIVDPRTAKYSSSTGQTVTMITVNIIDILYDKNENTRSAPQTNDNAAREQNLT